MNFTGNERRRHRVFITRNTEYHLRDGICVAVRDRHGRKLRAAHIALNLKLQGAVTVRPNGMVLPELTSPRIGDAIYFTQRDADGIERQIVTSRVERIERPAKVELQYYPPS
jgi:hypothetical protein